VAKRILVLLLLSFTGAFAQTDTPISTALKWQNVSSQYKSFDQIKPVLVNEGKESVFLSRIYPHGSAQLSRFNEGTRKWESGFWGIGVASSKIVSLRQKCLTMDSDINARLS
jgi:hypothetical protein